MTFNEASKNDNTPTPSLDIQERWKQDNHLGQKKIVGWDLAFTSDGTVTLVFLPDNDENTALSEIIDIDKVESRLKKALQDYPNYFVNKSTIEEAVKIATQDDLDHTYASIMVEKMTQDLPPPLPT